MSKKKSKTAKAILAPYKAQAYYIKELVKIIDSMEKELFKKFDIVADSATEEGILAFILHYLDKLPIIGKIALNFVNLINTVNEKKYKKGLETIGFTEIVTPDLEDLLAKAREYNVSLIKSIPTKMHSKLQIKLREAFENGGNIEKIIRHEFSVSRSRAKFIARDQTAKINHDLTSARARSNGSTSYQWRTSEDEAVRETAGHNHRKLNKKVFTWKSGSSCCGHPSDEHGCRCSARAIYTA